MALLLRAGACERAYTLMRQGPDHPPIRAPLARGAVGCGIAVAPCLGGIRSHSSHGGAGRPETCDLP